MRRFSILIMTLMLGLAASAQPINTDLARKAGTNFLLSKGLITQSDTLNLAINYAGDNGKFDCFYVFNVADGFVIVSADIRCVPILGYSFNGNFIWNSLPENFEDWLEGYRADIERGILANAPANDSLAHEWKLLIDGNFKPSPAPKDDTYLLTSTWEQGSGYNNYCPVMDGDHVVVGCVATSMAQIIRYWGYPSHPFGKSSYRHSTYGLQAVDFDTVAYDYSLMPDRIGRNSSAAQRDMVSRLCYHCGVTVRMNYQNPSHTTGSGARSSDVPDALRHFGYTNTQYISRSSINDDSQWRLLIRQEIDDRRPIYYSGASAEYGHAFVLDGYTTQNRFHFNWGWGGYSDGFYTLTTMQGFTSSNDMIVNIQPSGWEGNLDHFFVSPIGTGDGTSWEQANSNLEAALALSSIVDKDIWMREGTYFGTTDTAATYAYTLVGATSLYGGFEGTETTLNQRHPDQHPTILSGSGVRPVLRAYPAGRNEFKISDIVVQHGHSAASSCIHLSGDYLKADHLTVRHCTSDSGLVLSATDCLIRYSRFENNTAPLVCNLSDAALRQSIIAQNNADALRLEGHGRLVNSTIAANSGRGVIFTHARNSCINNIIWNNDTDIVLNTAITDTNIRNCAYICDSLISDSLSILLTAGNNDPQGPRFVSAPAGRGTSNFTGNEDWHLARGSICINAGERLSESMRDGDHDGALRCRQGIIDLGCYETNYPVSVNPVDATAFSVYPNPAASHVTLTGCGQGKATLLDALGRTLQTQSVSGTATFVLSSLPRGVYFLQFQEKVTKIIKK